MMSKGKGLVVVMVLVLAGQVAAAAPSGRRLEPLTYELQIHLDYPRHSPPRGIDATGYYEVYDRNFDSGGITGSVEIGAGLDPFHLQGPPPQGPGHPLASASSERLWTDNFSARLFRDGVEMSPAEFDIRFTPQPTGATEHPPPTGLVTVTKDNPAMARFRLAGPEGTPLEAGLYRLWIILDMRALPPAPGMFRGFAANDPGAYLGSGRPEPDPGHFGGLVFKLQDVDTSPEVMARYLAQQSVMETSKAAHERMTAVKRGDREFPSKESVPHYRKAIEFANAGLRYAPQDGDLLFQVAYSYVMLNKCQAALPYFHKLWEVDPKNPAYSAAWGTNRWVQSCATSDTLIPDPH